jgi:5'(3')-deoxyribonucleotidase
MLKNKTIAVDICNTLADVIKELNRRLGANPDPSIYFHPALKGKKNFFKENLDIFKVAQPIGNSAEKLRELAKNNNIVYITARPEVSREVTIKWLEEHNYPKADIYFTNNKVEIAKKLGVDLAIDDAPREIKEYRKAGYDVLVKKQSYNEEFGNLFDWEMI